MKAQMQASSSVTAPDTAPAGVAEPLSPRYEFSQDLVTLVDHRPREAEAIRTMRTHIIARHLRDGRRGLAVCGASKGVGSSFTAANLAVSLAQAGISTLLVDADLRQPGLEAFVKPQGPTEGLRQCLEAESADLSPFVHPEVIPNLSLLYAGGVAPDAQEMLASNAFRDLIERSLRDFEFTVIDTPPSNHCADARRISTVVGYAVVVARSNVSRVGDLVALAEHLQEDGARVVGTVLNEV
jgi:capsular exopolysaccharide synthesis family protein